ncbi:MAG: hypothetical protein ABGY75_20410, partial [Gemmataceae bacterium]
MSGLNWDQFRQLPGAADENFEQLCRALARRTYGQFVEFLATANQPGVEFHLRLLRDCSLGRAGEWFGWQCKWYEIQDGRPIGTTRQSAIEDSLRKTERHLPDITHWVLWTRRPLTAGDQQWFTGLPTKLKLIQWTEKEVGELLSGEATVLRATYFGELVLTPESLEQQHARAVAPIRSRWVPEAHQAVSAERHLRRLLGELEAWDDLGATDEQLARDVSAVETDGRALPGTFAVAVAEAMAYFRVVSGAVEEARQQLDRGRFDGLVQPNLTWATPPSEAVASLPRRLRRARHPANFSLTNALATARHARRLLAEIGVAFGQRVVAVLASAGCGKTQLAAELTRANHMRPAGVLLHGRDLQGGNSLDQLAGRIVVHGTPVRSFDALLAAVDAAGQRARRRIPLVIDGLNEAEDPRDWKRELAPLDEILRTYHHVLVVCTVRPTFCGETLPDSVTRLEIDGFGDDTAAAVGRYFSHFRINAADADLSGELLQHPLTLRLFCEVTNHDRSREVGVEAMPGSLTVLFERYLEQVSDRIAILSPPSRRFYPQDVRTTLVAIGTLLWEQRSRSLRVTELREQLGEGRLPWEQSLVRALEQDGVLLRDARDQHDSGQRVGVVHDRLAGHLVAEALLDQHGRRGLAAFCASPESVTVLDRASPAAHTLAEDILAGLVGTVPRRFHGEQVWRLVGEPLRSIALWQSAQLDGRSLDAATVEALERLAAESGTGWGDELFPRLRVTRGAASHPLDACFLDRVLRPMSVAGRDLHWTEWVRRNWENALQDVRRLEQLWRARDHRTPADRLRARWVMWLLTTTVRLLRDHATRALYWFGRADPAALFELAIDSLGVNDPYVPQRVLAAGYGVVMAHQQVTETFRRT